MTRRLVREQRRAQEQAKWIALDGDDWRDERDTDEDEYPEPEPEQPQRAALQ